MATEHSTHSASNITLADQIHAAALKIAADFAAMEDRLQGFTLVAIGDYSTDVCVIGDTPLVDVHGAISFYKAKFS